ncbi:MAG: RNA pseudouridine synthase [Phenylobacterium zucineum]|nr:MAG: RNA pseudouridine synthase [Phenylobacterium zucineum]
MVDLPPPEPDEDHMAEAVILRVEVAEAGGRLDKVLANSAPDLSRGRIQALMAQGHVRLDGKVLTDLSAKAVPGIYDLTLPPPTPAEPQAEAIALKVLYEDAHLIVIDKPPGMAVHPAPGSETGTLVNALLHHCGVSLSGIGGVARPGIVHRIDKDTSGIVVSAKSDAAHQGLSALFATHDIDRVYLALVRGAPKPQAGTLETRIGRSTTDRKKMAVLKSGGRDAVTHYETTALFGPQDKPVAALVACRLETGRTHQIRVHLAALGAPCLGDPVYGAGAPVQTVRTAISEAGLTRQALHAARLGFVHPVTGLTLHFESPLPDDMAQLRDKLTNL